MWNEFENCKMRLKELTERNDCKSENLSAKLKKKTNDLIDEYLEISVSKAKSKAIAYLLKNAEIGIYEEDLFASQIDHAGIMRDFLSERARKIKALEISDQVRELEQSKTIKAAMDFGHIAPDWQYVLDKGIAGIIKDLAFYGAKNPEKMDYYDERITVYNAIKDLFIRFAAVADGHNTDKSKFISDNLRHLAENPPETLAQAMQLILLLYLLQTDIDTIIIRSLGGLDRMLYPFYKNDLESGRYTKEQLSEITKYFLWKYIV